MPVTRGKTTKSVAVSKAPSLALLEESNPIVDCLLGVPGIEVNPKGTALNVGTIKHTQLITTAASGNFAVHPRLDDSMITVEVDDTVVNVALEFDPLLASAAAGADPHLPAMFLPVENVGTGSTYNGKFDGGLIALKTITGIFAAPIRSGGVIVPHSNLDDSGNNTTTGWWHTDKTAGSGGLCDFDIVLSRHLVSGESITLQMEATDGVNTISNGASWSVPLGVLESTTSGTAGWSGNTSSVASRVHISAYFLSPITVEHLSVDINGTNANGLFVDLYSNMVAIGLTPDDVAGVHGLCSTGAIALLGVAVWFEWSGTMQQSGTLALVEKPISTVGATMLGRGRIVALQKDERYGLNCKLDEGFIGFLAPMNAADYGTMDKIGNFAPWQSIYGNYTSVSTAAGGDRPQMNIKMVVVLGYVPDNVLAMPSNAVYDQYMVNRGLQIWSQFPLLHRNHNHMKTIKKGLAKAAKYVGKGIKVAQTVAKVGAMVAAVL